MSPKNEDGSKKYLDRRRFLQSLFGGLGGGTVLEEDTAAEAKSDRHKQSQAISFFWTNLKNGQVGFPTGTKVPCGQPGSVMKLVSAAALHESGLYTHGETVECRGTITLHNESYSCLVAHGKVDLIRAIGLSCNVFFATAAQQLSPRAYVEFAARFGFNTAVDGHQQVSFPDDKKLHSDSVKYALGLTEDLKPSALQILRLAGFVANRGHMPHMHNTGAIEPSSGPSFEIELKPGTWTILQQGMRLCDREGTAKSLDPADKLQLAVKTGTIPHGKAFQSWICGFFPYTAPKYAFCLRSAGGTSIGQAVPEARKWLFSAEWT